MKTILLLGVIVAAHLSTKLAYAGEGHNHGHNHEAAVEAAPHGGILRDSPPYKCELVLNNDQAKVYIYDKDLTPVTSARLASSATAELGFPKERTKRKIKFTLKGDVYEATLTGISEVHRYDLHLSLVVDKNPIIGDFGVDNIH